MSQIESKRIRLRRFKSNDFENMRLLEIDTDIMKFTPSRVSQTEEQTKSRLEGQIVKQQSMEPFGIWAAALKDDDAFVGWFGLIPNESESLELGFMLIKKFWGKGLATEICNSLIEFARTKNINEIIATTNIDNFASIRVLEKLGFKFKEKSKIPDSVLGGQIDVNVYGLKFG